MTADDEQRDADRAVLLRQIDRVVQAGERVPCLAGDTLPGNFWTSDDPDEQRLAADACLSCPAMLACETYGMTWTRETGVYGGRAERERRPLGRPKKSEETSA